MTFTTSLLPGLIKPMMYLRFVNKYKNKCFPLIPGYLSVELCLMIFYVKC